MAPYAFEDDEKRRYPSSSAQSREISIDEFDDFLLFPFLLVISPPFPPYPYPLLLLTLLSLETALLCRRLIRRLNRRDFDAQMKRERKRERERVRYFFVEVAARFDDDIKSVPGKKLFK
jgi:hypothetical protein|tara:strand:- start:1468 stop:1824 length:357 start_codon:yes stop_codon:yes gene_type:complete